MKSNIKYLLFFLMGALSVFSYYNTDAIIDITVLAWEKGAISFLGTMLTIFATLFIYFHKTNKDKVDNDIKALNSSMLIFLQNFSIAIEPVIQCSESANRSSNDNIIKIQEFIICKENLSSIDISSLIGATNEQNIYDLSWLNTQLFYLHEIMNKNNTLVRENISLKTVSKDQLTLAYLGNLKEALGISLGIAKKILNVYKSLEKDLSKITPVKFMPDENTLIEIIERCCTQKEFISLVLANKIKEDHSAYPTLRFVDHLLYIVYDNTRTETYQFDYFIDEYNMELIKAKMVIYSERYATSVENSIRTWRNEILANQCILLFQQAYTQKKNSETVNEEGVENSTNINNEENS